MFKRNDSNVWWTTIRHEGKRIQRSLGTTNKKLAQSIEAKIKTELVEGTYFEKRIGHNLISTTATFLILRRFTHSVKLLTIEYGRTL